MKSLQGHFLIATAKLADPNFFHSVILIIQHGEEGALGLIVNRPTPATVEEVCEKLLEEPGGAIDGNVYRGGPCEGPLMIVHDEETAKDMHVMDGVYFTTDKTKIEWLLQKHDGSAKVFVGYSGWSAGQLEAELASNSWTILPAKSGDVFLDQLQWQKLLTEAFVGQFVPAERIPQDPRVN